VERPLAFIVLVLAAQFTQRSEAAARQPPCVQVRRGSLPAAAATLRESEYARPRMESELTALPYLPGACISQY
jgi:hypothetical protein